MSLQASFSRSYPRRMRVLSYNIQSGIYTRHFGEYVTSSWKHVLPHRERVTNLDRIAGMLHGFDVVGLQEVDSGSLRSGFIDQTEYLAHRARFPYWYKQVNRSLGKIAQHSNGMLSRFRPAQISEYKLPGLPGRGALLIEFDTTEGRALWKTLSATPTDEPQGKRPPRPLGLPLALFGGVLFEPMAWTLISGMSLATLLTLVVIPACYALVERD